MSEETPEAAASAEGHHPKMDQLTAVYLKIRDKREERKREFEEEDSVLREQMDIIEQEMLALCKELGADSIKCSAGTVIRQVKTRYWTNDWDSMYRFIKDHDAFGLLEKRLHQTHMKEFLTENPDLLPIGLNTEREFNVTVRRSK